MIISDDFLKESNVLYGLINQKKFDKLICTFYKKDDLQYIHEQMPNCKIKNIVFKLENDKQILYYRGNEFIEIMKINCYTDNNILFYTFFTPLVEKFDLWIQLGLGKNFRVEFYE